MNTKIEEFKVAIRTKLMNQVREAEKGPLRTQWHDMGKIATSGNLTMIWALAKEVTGIVSEDEEVQLFSAIDNRRLRVGNYSGQLSVVYASDYPDRLVRTWQIDTELHNNKVATERILLSDDEFSGVINWMRTPYMATEDMSQFADLLPTEEEQVITEVNEASRLAEQVKEQNSRILAAQHRLSGA